MPYTAEISRRSPSCFLFLIDQSLSMKNTWSAELGQTRADGLADIINRLLSNLVIKCTKDEGVRDYYHVGVIGYGSDVRPALSGELMGRTLVPISEIAAHPLGIEKRTKKVPDGAGGLVDQTVKFPVWFESIADGSTPMCGALEMACREIGEFIRQWPACYPPLVINVTDGKAKDGNPEVNAEALRELSSEDGNVLLFNIHISSSAGSAIEFPIDDASLPDDFARRLFRMSSTLPPQMVEIARSEGVSLGETPPRGFVFNGDVISVIRFLDIGTRPSNLP